MGGLYLYFRFQDLAPLTGRRRWLATNPDYEKRMGDDVSRLKQGFCQAKENVIGRLLNAKIDDNISFEIFLSSKLLFLANNIIHGGVGADHGLCHSELPTTSCAIQKSNTSSPSPCNNYG